jgi:hypothetical protein
VLFADELSEQNTHSSYPVVRTNILPESDSTIYHTAP